MRRSVVVALAVACLALAACADDAPKGAATVSSSSATASSTPSTPTTTTATTTTTRATPRATPPKPSTTSRKPTSSALRTSLKGDPDDAFAFAPLSDPGNVTVEGNVSSYKAWSTSKVLVVAAFLDTVCDGDPTQATAQQRRWITAALTASDMNAVIALRDAIPGSPGAAINRVLRSIGDTRTVAPDTSQGGMQWTIREQVRFMAALASGRVVSRASSSYLLSVMHPIPAHQWGLGTIGASAFKGGWLRADTVTRQMGIVDGYAVAIITDHVGPAVVQTDGDAAHVQQMNYLATVLDRRLAIEGRRGPP
jgi:beta-lactamase family protein